MSIPVELPDLQAKTAEYGCAYFLTVRPDATPHIISLSPQWIPVGADGTSVLMLAVSAGTARNADAGTVVTLCYPPLDPDGYSLIVDGSASIVDPAEVAGLSEITGDGSAGPAGGLPAGKTLLRFDSTGAVLHRSSTPGFSNSATGCANDCLPVEASEG